MDISTVIGLVLMLGAIIGSIFISGDIGSFVDVPSIMTVVISVIGATFVRWPLEVVKTISSVVIKVFFYDSNDLKETINKVGELANKARRESIFELENVEYDDAFLKKAMLLAADNRPPEMISLILQYEIDSVEKRHAIGIKVFGGIAEDGPAFGMIGTLIGLVIMLANLSDQAAIGPAMAIALLTTFYGSLVANVVANPVKSKLEFRSQEEIAKMSIVVSGTLGIIAGENPRLIKEKLNSFLPPSSRMVDDFGGKK